MYLVFLSMSRRRGALADGVARAQRLLARHLVADGAGVAALLPRARAAAPHCLAVAGAVKYLELNLFTSTLHSPHTSPWSLSGHSDSSHTIGGNDGGEGDEGGGGRGGGGVGGGEGGGEGGGGDGGGEGGGGDGGGGDGGGGSGG
eukprot:CAMPEP_0119371808 /NCGR_PEP_ID=MMETSP1334-20130426/17909_1 /TAXON_ID=127549 /ORGANISM="Calcidiscus leptoporus, Strain RCC1130" /LENGTH=144 /DNA_ID=CAMNT_0007389159 /DNA_START=272 /DNA_END=703 /DNA_ORIENTATION=+